VYPPPPWSTEGWAAFRAYLVPVEHVRVPDGFSIEARGGHTLGLLGVVDYRPPSPLAYRELVWMPARVRAKRRDGRIARGFFVAKMFVDHEGSLEAGRKEWALPKQLARFESDDRTFEMRGSDGSHVRVSLGRRWPALPISSAIVTLQARDQTIVRFRGETRARSAPRSVTVDARGLDGTWMGLSQARPLGPLGVELRSFSTVMCAPEVLGR
jgi:hypothetical protein